MAACKSLYKSSLMTIRPQEIQNIYQNNFSWTR
jgi:hypothetical protein